MKTTIHILNLILLFSLPGHLFGQNGQSVEDLSRRQQKLYDQIRSSNNQGQLGEALEGLNDLLQDAPNFTEGYHMRGSIHYEHLSYESAVEDFEKVFALEPDYDPLVQYQLALAEKGRENYSEAVKLLEKFISIGYKRESLIERAKKHLEDARFAETAVKKPIPFTPENIGAPISTEDPEALPQLSADGKTLIFTRLVNNQEDFYTAEKQDGKWTNVQPLKALNTPFSEGAHSISADGRLLVFTFCQSGPDQGGCNLFYAEKCNGNWSQPEKIAGSLNTGAWESQPTLSADGSLLLFVSDRPGGLGGKDIWASRRNTSGNWGKPVNLGEAINTPGNEISPFLHADGRTLYFSSDGRPGMGGIDLYRVQLQENGQWGEVKNLGYPINTPDNEGAISISLDGKTGFFAKGEKRQNNIDIFTFPVYKEIAPLPVTYVEGNIFDSKTGKKISAQAELIDLESGRPVARVTNCEDGSYLVCLTAGRDYALNVNKDGYLFFSENFSLRDADLSEPFKLDVPLQPIEPVTEMTKEDRKPVVLKNVFFATASAELLPVSTNELDRLYNLLEDNPEMRIQINGHTDNVGGDEANQQLSEARAKAVYSYLLGKGIAEERLKYKGFGETQFIADNETEEGRQQNRRTEFELW